MIRKTMMTATFVTLAAGSAFAQDPRVEISGTAGWTFSDGVSGEARTVPGVGTFDRVDPKDAFSWGAQSTQYELGGTATFEVGDVSVRNYHGYLAYNFGDPDATVRPYVLGGLGATQYGTLDVNVGGIDRSVDGDTQFSSTWFPNPRFGLRLEGRWTPTYIKSDAAGWWCDPFWGCYVVGDAQYANQFELSGGITLRF